MQHVFIIGSKGIPASYGGYETFVDRLTEEEKRIQEESVSSGGNGSHQEAIQYHVACKPDVWKEAEYHGALCDLIPVPNLGPATAVFYDLNALKFYCRYIEENQIENPIVYILACRIGPFFHKWVRRIHALGGQVHVNPDGHEWMRAKWPLPIRKYWKYSERLMVKHADLLVCDSQNIESYIKESYAKYQPKTTYIAYGADVEAKEDAKDDKGGHTDSERKYRKWLSDKGLNRNKYYLIVGRFVPENNYETMIREFMQSKTEKKLAIVTNVGGKFYDRLERLTGFVSDERIAFVGTVYDKELLREIRQGAYAYLHGHEVGGTNPSLLEALGATRLNLLLDVGFNREVGQEGALYWKKSSGSLQELIEYADQLPEEELNRLGKIARERILSAYSWTYINSEYRRLYLGNPRE